MSIASLAVPDGLHALPRGRNLAGMFRPLAALVLLLPASSVPALQPAPTRSPGTAATVAGNVESVSPHLTDRPEWQQACAALAHHLPELAVAPLEKLRAEPGNAPANGTLSLADQNELRLLLAEALVRSGRFRKGLDALDSMPPDNANRSVVDRTLFWQAHALLGLGAWEPALQRLKEVESDGTDSALAAWSCLGQATALRALDRPGDALDCLERQLNAESVQPALTRRARELALEICLETNRLDRAGILLGPVEATESPRLTLQRAELAFSQGNLEFAENLLLSLLGRGDENDSGLLGPTIEGLATLQLARVLDADQRRGEAVATLVTYLESHPLTPLLVEQFRQLAELGWHRDGEIPPQLLEWQTSAPVGLRRGAIWLLAQRSEANPDTAMALYRQLVDTDHDEPFAQDARLRLAILAARRGDAATAAQVFGQGRSAESPDQRLFTRLFEAQARLDSEQADLAVTLLHEVAEEHPEANRDLLAWNRAVATLDDPNSTTFQIAVEELGAEESRPLRLAALEEAIRRDAEPAEIRPLIDALDELPAETPDLAEGVIAAVAWALDHPEPGLGPPRMLVLIERPARENLAADTRRQLDELTFRASLLLEEDDAALQALEAYAARYPDDPRLGLLRLQLAEELFLRGDFAGALQQYDQFLRARPENEAATLAAYGAALATLQLPTDDALRSAAQRFGEIVADQDSPFRFEALLGQAQSLRRLGEFAAAARLLEDARGENWTRQRRHELDVLLAEALFPLGGDSREQGLALWREIVDDKEVPLAWRERAAWQLGQAWEQLGREEEALPVYWEVVRGLAEQPAADPGWYHASARSGLALLERQRRWQAAVEFAELAASRLEGESAVGYRQRAREIHLMHFIEE